MKKIDLYIIKNIAINFLISFIITTLIMLIGNLIKIYDILFEKGVSLSIMGNIFWNTTVFLSIFTIPMSLTIGINFVYAQLSGNSETIAMRSSGISLKRIYLPAFVFSVFVFIVLFYDISFLAYKAKLSYRINITRAFKNKIYVGLKKQRFYTAFNSTTIYADKISPDKRKLYNVFYAKKGSVITAKEADFKDIPFGLIINFKRADIYKKNKGVIEFGAIKNYEIALSVNNGKQVTISKNDTRYMNIKELINYYKQSHELDALYKINKMLVLSVSVFVLSIIGFVFGITLARSGKSAGIIISLSIFFAFYILELLGESMYKNYHTVWTIWLPDVLLLILGIYIFYKKSTN